MESKLKEKWLLGRKREREREDGESIEGDVIPIQVIRRLCIPNDRATARVRARDF